MINLQRERAARTAANTVRNALKIKDGVDTGIVLGTGWGDKLNLDIFGKISLSDVEGFEGLQYLEGHKREFVFGYSNGVPVIVLNGRIHLNEDPGNPELFKMVRLQTEIMMQLQVKKLIVTCAAGLLPDEEFVQVGDIVIINSFVTVFAPQMPLWAGEFCNPEDALSQRLMAIAGTFSEAIDYRAFTRGYAMLLGPWFEGRALDKQALSETGARLVGMSTLPEACIASLYDDVEMLALAFVSNDSVAEHSHEQNITMAKEKSSRMGEYLSTIIQKI
jgi:purine-nucleoside phosphorylase